VLDVSVNVHIDNEDLARRLNNGNEYPPPSDSDSPNKSTHFSQNNQQSSIAQKSGHPVKKTQK